VPNLRSKRIINVVAHSFGCAYAKGLTDYFLGEGIIPNTDPPQSNFSKFGSGSLGNFYIVAPENAIGESDELAGTLDSDILNAITLVPENFESVFQYGSDFRPVDESIGEGDPKCKQDGVAPQILVRGLPEDFTKNAFFQTMLSNQVPQRALKTSLMPTL
jgi:hypothetical protein